MNPHSYQPCDQIPTTAIIGKTLSIQSFFSFPFCLLSRRHWQWVPFLLGLERLATHNKSQAAWDWCINGCVSVVSTGLAAIVSVELGFSAVMLIACAAYGLAALSAAMLEGRVIQFLLALKQHHNPRTDKTYGNDICIQHTVLFPFHF